MKKIMHYFSRILCIFCITLVIHPNLLHGATKSTSFSSSLSSLSRPAFPMPVTSESELTHLFGSLPETALQQVLLQLKNITNDIDFWAEKLGRPATSEEIKGELNQALQELQKTTLNPETVQALIPYITHYVRNARAIKFYKQELQKTVLYFKKNIDAWRANFPPKPTEERAMKQYEIDTKEVTEKKLTAILEEFDIMVAALQHDPEITELANLRAIAFFSSPVVHQELTKLRDTVEKYVTKNTSNPSTLPDELRLHTASFGELGGPTWLTELLGWHQIFSSEPGTASYNSTCSADGSMLGVSTKERTQIFERDKKSGVYEPIFTCPYKLSFYSRISNDDSTLVTEKPITIHGKRDISIFKRIHGAYQQVFATIPEMNIQRYAISDDSSTLVLNSETEGQQESSFFKYNGKTYVETFPPLKGIVYAQSSISADGSLVLIKDNQAGHSTLLKQNSTAYTPVFTVPSQPHDAVIISPNSSIIIIEPLTPFIYQGQVWRRNIGIFNVLKRHGDSYDYIQIFTSPDNTKCEGGPMLSDDGTTIMAIQEGGTILDVFVYDQHRNTFSKKISIEMQIHWGLSNMSMNSDGSVIAIPTNNGFSIFIRGFDGIYRKSFTVNPEISSRSKRPLVSTDGQICMYTSENNALHVFAPIMTHQLFAQLHPSQIELLHDLYLARILRTKSSPTTLQLNPQQTLLWNALPAEISQAVIANNPRIIVRPATVVTPTTHTPETESATLKQEENNEGEEKKEQAGLTSKRRRTGPKND